MAMMRWGIISTGSIARTMMASMRHVPGCVVQAIASRDLDRARTTAAAFDVPDAYGTYAALMAAADIDAVYIAVPNHMHADLAIAAAEAGKHVLCEKPFARSAAEGAAIVEAAARNGVAVMEAFMYRFHPLWDETRALVRSGAIGELVTVEVCFTYFNDDPGDIRNQLATAGGALDDIGCYCVDSTRLLFDAEPVKVHAVSRRDPTSGVDVLTSGLLEFPTGTGTFTCATRVQPDQRVHVIGSAGRIELSDPSRPFNLPVDGVVPLRVARGGGHLEAGATEAIDIEATDPYAGQVAAFAECVLAGRPVPIDPAWSIANLRVLDAVRASAASGVPVDLG